MSILKKTNHFARRTLSRLFHYSIRDLTGLTQSEMASYLGIAKATYLKFEVSSERLPAKARGYYQALHELAKANRRTEIELPEKVLVSQKVITGMESDVFMKKLLLSDRKAKLALMEKNYDLGSEGWRTMCHRPADVSNELWPDKDWMDYMRVRNEGRMLRANPFRQLKLRISIAYLEAEIAEMERFISEWKEGKG